LSTVFIALLTTSVCAEEGQEVLSAIHFSIKPRLCVLAEGEEVCRDELEVHWASERQQSLCLYQDGQPMPLQCWLEAKSGFYRFTLTASSSTDFQLRSDNSEQALGREVFEVVYQQKKYRRQRRNPWSFF
jgi:hypothetical protein